MDLEKLMLNNHLLDRKIPHSHGTIPFTIHFLEQFRQQKNRSHDSHLLMRSQLPIEDLTREIPIRRKDTYVVPG